MPYTPRNQAQANADETFRQLGGQVVAFRADWAERLNSIHAALVLQQLIFEARLHSNDEGWFFVTAEDMREHTAVAEKSYRKARTELEALGIIETKRAGVPAKTFIRFDWLKLDDWMNPTDDTWGPRDFPGTSDQERPEGESRTANGPDKTGERADVLREVHTRGKDENSDTDPEAQTAVPETSTHQQAVGMVQAWAEHANGGRWPVAKPKAIKQAKDLVEAGFVPENIPSMLDWARADDFWKDKPLDFGALLHIADRWSQSQQKPKKELLFGDYVNQRHYQRNEPEYHRYMDDKLNGTLPDINTRGTAW